MATTNLQVVTLPSQQSHQPPPTASYDPYRGSGIPIVIDNGASTIRYGFASVDHPQVGPNVISKYKDRRTNRPIHLFGDAIEIESGAKAQAKYAWEGDVLLSFDALEGALDHAFLRLGIDTEVIEHPIFMTERICSPLHSRKLTSELLYELYQVPSAVYCLDSIMSLYYNETSPTSTTFSSDALIFGFNTSSTSIIPVLGGRGILSASKRIPWGVTQSSEYLLKQLHLKYPNFPGRLNWNTCNWMYRNFCAFSDDYAQKLKWLRDPLNLTIASKVIQFPFSAVLEAEKTEEELAKITERRKEQGKKLQEMAARVRLEKLIQKETDLAELIALKESRGSMAKRDWIARLQHEGIDGDMTLDETIKKLELALKKARKKEMESDEAPGEPSFPLLEVPDAELDEGQLKEKRKQRLMKAGYDARIRARLEKDRERGEKEAEERREEEERNLDLAAWSLKLRQQHEMMMVKIRDRGRRRAALNDRKSAASQARMKSIANLASEEKVGRKKRKAPGDDMFGANDDDWAIYRKINIDAASSDGEDDMLQLESLEQRLLLHDPTFTDGDTHAALTNRRSALISAFRPDYPEGDIEGHNRIHLNVERWRIPETYFNPSIAGVDSAGLGEVAHGILSSFSESDKARLVKNVFVSGSPSLLPGLTERLLVTLRPILSPGTPVNIRSAEDPTLDAWRGMARFARSPEFSNVVVTRDEYYEWGGERIRRWWGSNWNSAR